MYVLLGVSMYISTYIGFCGVQRIVYVHIYSELLHMAHLSRTLPSRWVRRKGRGGKSHLLRSSSLLASTRSSSRIDGRFLPLPTGTGIETGEGVLLLDAVGSLLLVVKDCSGGKAWRRIVVVDCPHAGDRDTDQGSLPA